MNTSDKTIFYILLSIIIVLVGFMGFVFLKTNNNLEVFTNNGNKIIKLIKNKKTNMSISNNLYQKDSIEINYPYIDGAGNIVNNIIYEQATSIKNDYNTVNTFYEIKQLNDKFISIIFYGTHDEKNYSQVVNIDIEKETKISTDDIFKDKNQLIAILKSTKAHKYLEKEGLTLKRDYLNSLTYDELLNSNDIDIYFKEDKIGIIICNIPESLNSYYLSIEVGYDELEKSFIEKEYTPFILEEEKLREFLIGDKIITENNKILNYPNGYVFTENNFSYYHGETSPTYDGEILSYRGQWWIDSNKLILHVIEEEKTTGGQNLDGILTNYKKQIYAVDYNIEYNIENMNNSYLVINDYDKILYYLNIDPNYINNFKILADIGYKEYNKTIENYYKVLGQ